MAGTSEGAAKAPQQLTMIDLFKHSREGWLAECRKTAKLLLRNMDSITIEDVTRLVPRPTYLHRNATGSVFNHDFIAIGFVPAQHAAAKGRYIRQWILKKG